MTLEELENLLLSESVYITTSTNPNIELHGHSFFEFVYVLEGSVLQTKNGVSSILKKGDFFVVDYGVTHMYTKVNDDKFQIINCLFLPRLIDESLGNSSRFKDLVNNYLIKLSYKNIIEDPINIIFHDDQDILHIFNKMIAEYKKREVGNLEIIRSYIIVVIITMMRSVTPPDIIVTDNISQHIINYINLHYMNPIHLGDFCTILNYCLPYLSKKFKNETGLSFTDYLQRIRIEHSCRLLSNTDKKIDIIAVSVGYNNTHYFNTIFKKTMKMSPRSFRKLYRSNFSIKGTVEESKSFLNSKVKK